MDRRRFVGSVAGGLLAVPLAVRAQHAAMPVIGFLSSASPAQWTSFVSAFRQGLNEVGYIEGKNVGMEFRWAEGHYDRMPALAADLVRRQVSVLVASGSTGARAAKAATSAIPIVYTGVADPVGMGLVASLGRPAEMSRALVSSASSWRRSGWSCYMSGAQSHGDRPACQSRRSVC